MKHIAVIALLVAVIPYGLATPDWITNDTLARELALEATYYPPVPQAPFDAARYDQGSGLERRWDWPTWNRGGWFQASVGLLAGAVVAGREVWTAAISNCIQWTSNWQQVAIGVNCIYNVIHILFRAAVASRGTYADSERIMNTYYGQVKRDDNSTTTSHNEILEMLSSVNGYNVTGFSRSSAEIENAITLYSAYESGITAHTFNETHGHITMKGSSNQTAAAKRDMFSFHAGVEGIKLSYVKPCANNDLYFDSVEGQDFYKTLWDMANWMYSTELSDKYAFEMYNPANHNANYLYGTLIAESSGFGDGFEGFPYDLATGC